VDEPHRASITFYKYHCLEPVLAGSFPYSIYKSVEDIQGHLTFVSSNRLATEFICIEEGSTMIAVNEVILAVLQTYMR